MSHARALLGRLLDLVGQSDAYFVSGSYSFLPRLGHYRAPGRDIDVAVDRSLFAEILKKLRPDEQVHALTLSEVALASSTPISRLLPGRTSFVHVETAFGLLDFAHFRRTPAGLAFQLSAGFSLVLPQIVLDRIELLDWEGLSYRAGPPELAFLPKAVASRRDAKPLAPHHVKDMRRLAALADPALLNDLVRHGGVRWLGLRLPKMFDPFAGFSPTSWRH